MNERIKELRKYLGLSQEDFGSKVGVTRSAVSKLESSDRGVTEQMLILICREFNVNEEWLRTGSGGPDNMFLKTQADELAELRQKYDLDDLDVKIIMEYLKLQPEQRKIFKVYLNNIVGSAAMDPQDEIEIKTAAYRQELEAEKHSETSEALPSTNEKKEKIS